MWLKHQRLTCVILLGLFQLAQSAFLRCFYNDITLNDYVEVPLRDGKCLITNGCVDVTKQTLFYIFGFGGKTNGTATTSVLRAAVALGYLNVILVNWEKEATNSLVASSNPITKQLTYTVSAVPATFKVGTDFGNAIVSMSKAGLNLERTFIVGHSLGAQVAAQGGRTVKKNNLSVQVIIGLDAAGPLFGDPTNLPHLAADCATFVYSVVTDPGGYGINKTQSHVDILVNCKPFFTETDEEKQVQPGCPIGKFQMLTEEDTCSHNFSWRLFTESLTLYHTLLASKAINCQDWLAGNGNSSDYVNIGLDIDQTKRGIYCLATNSAYPYGKGADGLRPSSA